MINFGNRLIGSICGRPIMAGDSPERVSKVVMYLSKELLDNIENHKGSVVLLLRLNNGSLSTMPESSSAALLLVLSELSSCKNFLINKVLGSEYNNVSLTLLLSTSMMQHLLCLEQHYKDLAIFVKTALENSGESNIEISGLQDLINIIKLKFVVDTSTDDTE